MKKERNIAFVVELLLLFVILLLVIVVITKTLMTSRSQSLHAKYLTEAVCLAEETAEVTSSADSREGARALLESLGQVKNLTEEGEITRLDMIFAEDDAQTADTSSADTSSADTFAAGDTYQVEIVWGEEPSEQGSFVTEEIIVYRTGQSEPLYTLHAGNYKRGA